ncbi:MULTISPECIES: response regulator [unclassified Frankia]
MRNLSQDPAGQRPADSEPARHGGTILIAEDDAALLEVARRILSRNGYEVLAASTALDACSIAIEHRGDIHLLLTDVIMPRMQGTELANRIRAQQPGIRVLYMSGYADPVLTAQGKLDPGVSLLTKPFSERTLLDKVRQVLDAPR